MQLANILFYTADDEPIPEPPRYIYEPEISEEAIKAIILREMHRQNVFVQDIEEGTRYFLTKGFAWFTCQFHDRYRRWPSRHSWCHIDLKKQRISKRYSQQCREDDQKAEPGPEFTEESIKEMAEYAVKSFLKKSGRLQLPPSTVYTETEQTEGGPHDEARCERCQELRRSCWKRKTNRVDTKTPTKYF